VALRPAPAHPATGRPFVRLPSHLTRLKALLAEDGCELPEITSVKRSCQRISSPQRGKEQNGCSSPSPPRACQAVLADPSAPPSAPVTRSVGSDVSGDGGATPSRDVGTPWRRSRRICCLLAPLSGEKSLSPRIFSAVKSPCTDDDHRPSPAAAAASPLECSIGYRWKDGEADSTSAQLITARALRIGAPRGESSCSIVHEPT
jgi:hypothetical protein